MLSELLHQLCRLDLGGDVFILELLIARDSPSRLQDGDRWSNFGSRGIRRVRFLEPNFLTLALFFDRIQSFMDVDLVSLRGLLTSSIAFADLLRFLVDDVIALYICLAWREPFISDGNRVTALFITREVRLSV